MTRPTPRSAFTLTVLSAGILTLGGVLSPTVLASPEPGDGTFSPWPIATETHSAADFLATALPVASNKSDLDNEAAGFFRVPTPTAHEPGTILYVGLRAERAPDGGPYSAPLFSGSVESFDLGIGGAQAAPQTVGDIGEIYPEDVPPVPMAYIVYRLDFSTHGGDKVALFGTPTVTTEPFTTSSPDELNARFAWEEIRFSEFGTPDENGPVLKDDRDSRNGRAARATAAPEPTSVGLLVIGTIGLGLWRRQRTR